MINRFIDRIRLHRYHGHRIVQARKQAKLKSATFAQDNEDLVIGILLGKVKTFIDIGANDGLLFSNTYLFAENGAHGICFEPSPRSFHLLCRVHKKNPNIICVNEAIASQPGQIEFFEDGYSGLLSTAFPSNKSSQDLDPIIVRSNSLEPWIRKYERFRDTDLLSIDVEGAEVSVLEGIDFGFLAPKIIVIEIDNPDLSKVNQIITTLEQNGYIFYCRNSHNAFFIRKDILIDHDVSSRILALSPAYQFLPKE
jgi:FkbM family methyltransferase